jgi:dCTP deaminase
MLIVGDNLKELMSQYKIVTPQNSSYDTNCICLSLDKSIISITPPEEEENSIITYGSEIPKNWINEKVLDYEHGLILDPKMSVLACSFEKINIPSGYFGLLQTKGSLARLFVSINCSDGQVESGFNGKITFEMCNFSDFRIRLRPGDRVGSLFIFKTSSKNVNSYQGRYNLSDKPTIQKSIQ